MPKVNPNNYDDDFEPFGDDYNDWYDEYDEDYEYSYIYKSDLDTESELIAWDKIRQWGNPYLNQRWVKDVGVVYECRIWFGSGANTIECSVKNPSIELGLNDLLAKIKEEVFGLCNRIT